MPKYRVELTDGRKFEIEADAPPSEQDVLAALGGQTPQESAPESKSFGGFLSNAVSSTGKLLVDTAKGTYGLAKFISDINPGAPLEKQVERARQVYGAVTHAPQIAGAIGQAAKDRYGSLDAIGNTLYSDPAGVAADVSALLSMGGTALGTKAPRLGGFLAKAGEVTNPLQVLKPAAKAVEGATAAAIRPMLGPPTALVRQQRAPLEIERTALKTGAVTERAAGRKLGAAKAKTDEAAAAATAAGRATSRDKIAQFPKTLKEVEDVTPNVRELDDLASLESDTVASLPDKLTPTQLLEKRRAQDRAVNTAYRAEEKGGYIRSIADKGRKEIADNMRSEFRDVVPEAAASDDLARRLGMVRGSLEHANTRPRSIPMGGALFGLGGGALLGGPAGAATGAAFGTGRLFPQVPLALGSVPVRATAAAATPAAQQGLLLTALLERLMGGDQ
jgi:hypothetical protein